MSELVVPFVYELRRRGLRVGAQEAGLLARALSLGLHADHLDGFYYVARALLVHREADLDRFDEAFSAHFKGVIAQSAQVFEALEEWLRDPKILESLTEEQRRALEELTPEEVRRLLEERLREQRERHEGGSQWIGTGGTSPFGTGGYHPSGVSLRAGSAGRGGRGALGLADARKYRPYRDDVVLDLRQVEVALRKLRATVREGALTELDVERTIDATAKNAGELEIVVRPPRKSSLRVLLLMDVGGSMDPFAQTCSQLFSAAKRASHFRELRTYYFHNAIYGRVYTTDTLMQPLDLTEALATTDARWKLIIVGDAAMAPAELLGSHLWGPASGPHPRSGLEWLQHLAARYERSAWLNPDPPQYWRGGTAKAIGTVFPMFHLSLEGLTEAMAHLAKGEVAASRG